MSNEFRILTSDDQQYLVRKVDFLMAAFEKLRTKEVDHKGGQDGRLGSIDEIRLMLSRWGPCKKITVPDERRIEQNFGLFFEAIKVVPTERRKRSKTAESLEEIFQKFIPEKV